MAPFMFIVIKDIEHPAQRAHDLLARLWLGGFEQMLMVPGAHRVRYSSTRNVATFVKATTIACHQGPEALGQFLAVCNSSPFYKRHDTTSTSTRVGGCCTFFCLFFSFPEQPTGSLSIVDQAKHTMCYLHCRIQLPEPRVNPAQATLSNHYS